MFRKRLNILTFAGIKIGVDLSWIIIAVLLSWTLAAGYFPEVYPKMGPGTYWAMGIVGMLGLFVCVLLHELGHALVAKHYRLPISQITLFVFGGVAEIKKEPQSPKVEFLMAIAGPIVSVVLSAIMFFLTKWGEQGGWPVAVVGITGYLALINAVIVAFNLIPAFPLDGGRVFRSILWAIKRDFNWATRIATRVGAGFGMLLILFGIFLFFAGNIIGGVWLAILGFFLQRAAGSSQTQSLVADELRGEKVAKFMVKDPDSVSPDIALREFIDEHVYASHHHLYPVVEKKELLGYISLIEVKGVPAEEWGKTKVKNAMVPIARVKTVAPDTSALEALNAMQESETTTLLVVKDGKLVGLLTAQDLFKLLSLKFELER